MSFRRLTVALIILLLVTLLFQTGAAKNRQELLQEHLETMRTIRAVSNSALNQQKIATAILMYRVDKGRLPAKLSQLKPKYFKALPPDMISSEPFRYKRVGKGFDLWRPGPALKSPKISKGYPRLAVRNPGGFKVYYNPNKLWPVVVPTSVKYKYSNDSMKSMDKKSARQLRQKTKKHKRMVQKAKNKRLNTEGLLNKAARSLRASYSSDFVFYKSALKNGGLNPLQKSEIQRFMKVFKAQ